MKNTAFATGSGAIVAHVAEKEAESSWLLIMNPGQCVSVPRDDCSALREALDAIDNDKQIVQQGIPYNPERVFDLLEFFVARLIGRYGENENIGYLREAEEEICRYKASTK